MALRLVLLCVPLAASLRSGERLESLASDATGDECDEEALQTHRLLQALGFTGPLNQSHCDLPGISCAWKSCRVETLECATCSGRLPSQIHLKHLKTVSLTSPTLSGDIKSFEGTQLEKLELKGKVFGDIQVFQKMKNLTRLILANSQVTGHLHVLEKLEHLDTLSLADTQVVGHLSSMAGAIRMRLELSGTGVTGNLSDLIGHVRESGASQNMAELMVLKLSRTRVTGNFGDLIPCRNLMELDLSHTQVFGRIQQHWRGWFRNIRILQLRNSSVQFVPSAEDMKSVRAQWSSDRSLRRLTDLDLTHCPVNDSLENLLVVLVDSSVTSIKAVGAGISGAVPRVEDLQVTIDGEALLSFEAFRKLNFLDLSQNNLTELREVLVQPNAGRMLLRENLQIKVAPGTLAKFLKERVILDLSGTKLLNQEDEASQLLEEGQLTTTDMYAYTDETAGYACKDLTGTVMKVTPSQLLPEKLCTCLAGWHGHGATCEICPANMFSDQMGLDSCKSCPANSTAPEGSTKLADCKCQFGDLHDGACSCDKHQTLRDGNCIICSKLHLQCETAGIRASRALPEVRYARLEPQATEARRCLPPDVSERCPGSHQCGLGYSGTLCATCANQFRATGGRCEQCVQASSPSIWFKMLLGVAAVLLVIYAIYRRTRGHQVPQPASAGSQLKTLMVLQAPGLLQVVQLWAVLSQLRRPGQSISNLPEIPYVEALQLTFNDIQNSVSLQCIFDAATVRTAAALASPLLPLFLLACTAALEFCHAGRGVAVLLKVLPFLFIGGAYSTANLLSCQFEDGDGKSLGTFAFRRALPQLHCYDGSGIGFWVDVVGYSSALAYGILIPLLLAALMRQNFALQHARLFYARVDGEPRDITLRLEMLQGHMPQEALPKRLLAAAAAYMAVHCRGKRRQVRLHDGCITTSSENEDVEEAEKLSMVKVVAGTETSRNFDVLKTRRLTKMLTERIMLDESEDRLLIGSQSLLAKYTLSEDVWIYVVLKVFAVSLVCCVSISDAWKWAIAFNLGMAVLIAVGQPYMWPQVSELQSFSCVCLAVTSVAFAYDFPWLARLGLLAPLLLLLWQARRPDCTESMAQRLYKELESELPRLQRGEPHTLHVQQLRF